MAKTNRISNWADPRPVRAHVQQLLDAGLIITQIETLANVPPGTVYRLMAGYKDQQKDQQLARRIHRAKAEAILAIPMNPAVWPPLKRHGTSRLAPREIAALRLVAVGRSNVDIGAKLHLSEHTVKTHIQNARDKLGARNRTHAVVRAIALGVLPLPTLEEAA